MKCVDMVWFATDDPEICSHPANCLMVRVGPTFLSPLSNNSIVSDSIKDLCTNRYATYINGGYHD